MGVAAILTIVALALAVIEQFNARGRSLIAWAVIAICVALLWGQF